MALLGRSLFSFLFVIFSRTLAVSVRIFADCVEAALDDWRGADKNEAAQQRLEADADLAALDPRSLSLIR